MKWFIGYQSALELWRECEESLRKGTRKYNSSMLPTKPSDSASLRHDNLWGLSSPLHIVVGNPSARKVSKGIKSHYCSIQLPPGSSVKVDDITHVSSPELCFLQMAKDLSLVDLIALGFELCGSYSLPSKGSDGFRKREPLTNIASIRHFLEKTKGTHGHRCAVRASKYVIDGAAS
ncbi:MAG: hypothetical protein LBJ48_07905, partial [Coriobacteriales bacterium]|nr:hypothetical protein [Coriobacteriales bacterium]